MAQTKETTPSRPPFPLPLPLPPGRIDKKNPQEAPKPETLAVFSHFPPKYHVLDKVPEDDNDSYSSRKEPENACHGDPDQSRDYYLDDDEENRSRSACCYKCCAWTCMVVCLFLLIVFIVGLAAVAFIRSSLPEVYLTRYKVSGMEVVTSSKNFVLNAEVKALVELSNKNEKTLLYYSPLMADVSIENVWMGGSKLSGFTQGPNNMTTVVVSTTTKKLEVTDFDATILTSNFKKNQMVVDVILRGKIGVDFGGIRLHFPLVIACEDVKQADIDRGEKQNCHVKVSS